MHSWLLEHRYHQVGKYSKLDADNKHALSEYQCELGKDVRVRTTTIIAFIQCLENEAADSVCCLIFFLENILDVFVTLCKNSKNRRSAFVRSETPVAAGELER